MELGWSGTLLMQTQKEHISQDLDQQEGQQEDHQVLERDQAHQGVRPNLIIYLLQGSTLCSLVFFIYLA